MFDNDEEKASLQTQMTGSVGFQGEFSEMMVPAAGRTSWKFYLMEREGKRVRAKLSIDLDVVSEVEGAAEWGVSLNSATAVLWENQFGGSEVEVQLETHPLELELNVEAPKGAAFGDRLAITIEAWPESNPMERSAVTFSASARQSILALKTSIGHEKNVADSVYSKAKAGKSGIFAILSPTNLRGYVLLEGMNTDQLREAVKGVRRARGLVEGETSFEEINHFLTPKPLVSGIMEGDVVELIAGPFKGEKARVQQIDENKEEITVELFEAMVPIPVTVRGDHVRVLEKER
jgi:transcription termination/antitermination protein NusG